MPNISNMDKRVYAAMLLLVVMMAARIIITDSITYIFIFWNLFLALVPYWFSKLFYRFERLKRWQQVLLTVAWFLVLPNAFYVITDLVHLRPTESPTIWLEISFLFLSAVTATACGVLSLVNFERLLRRHLKPLVSNAVVVGILMLCGFGVYLGRFDRWNSWDVLHQPFGVAYDVLKYALRPIKYQSVWRVSIGFGLMFSVLYFLMRPSKAGVNRCVE